MDRKRSKLHDWTQKTGLSRKINFWIGLVLCLTFFVTTSANSSTRTPVGFHNFFERLVSTNNTKRFTAVDKSGGTVLHKAVKYFPVLNQTLDIFKAHNVDFNAVDKAGNSAFSNAVEYGRNASFLATLISYGMDWKTRNENGNTALHVAAFYGNLEAVNLLLLLGSDVNARNSYEQTPLHQAVLSQNVSQTTFEIVSQLVNSGANPNFSDKDSSSALHLAAGNSHLDCQILKIIRFLIENNGDANAVKYLGDTFLHVAAINQAPVVLNELVEYLDSINNTKSFTIEKWFGETVLHKAVENMEVQNETLAIFQRRGVDFNAINYSQWNILLVASKKRSASFLKTLVAFGADWKRKNSRQETIVHVAARWGNFEALKLFLTFGADVNEVNKFGETTLHYAFRSSDNFTRLDIISELVKHGANGNIQNEFGDFPRDIAQQEIEKGKRVEEGITGLLENMKNRPSFNHTEFSDSIVKSSFKVNSILGQLEKFKQNSSEITRIFQIVHREDLETIHSVLGHVGKSRDIREIWDEKHHSLLHVAIKYRDYSIVEYLLNGQEFAKKLNDTEFNANLVQLCLENIETVLPPTFEHKSRVLQLLFSIKPKLIESRFKKSDVLKRQKNVRTEWEDRTTFTPLLYSTFHNFTNGKQLELIKMLIDNNANVNSTTSEYNFTVLHLAAAYQPPNCLQIFHILIENHADVNAVDEFGNSFLHFVARGANPGLFHETVAYLDSINNTNSFKHFQETVLHLAAASMEVRNETLGIFQRRGVDFNAVDNNNKSILFEAVCNGRSYSVLKSLIAFGADWRIKNKGQTNFLHVAADYGNLDALKLFIELGADVNAVDKFFGETPLHTALSPYAVPSFEIVRELVNHGANLKIRTKSGALAIDLVRQNYKIGDDLKEAIIELFKNAKVEPVCNQSEVSERAYNQSVKVENIVDELKQLKWDSCRISRIFEIVLIEDLDTLKGVLENVGDGLLDITEIWNEDCYSLLHVAIKHRDFSVVEYLINGQQFAKKLSDPEFNANVVELCMENMNAVSQTRFEQKFRVLQLLFHIQPDLIESMVEIVSGYELQGTPLHYSTAKEFTNGKQLELIEMLIDNNANVNAKTSHCGWTVLQNAAYFNPLEATLAQIIRSLIENHADANAVDEFGNTFLHYVAMRSSPKLVHETVEYLDSINNTVSFIVENKKERIVLHEAVKKMDVFNETLEIFKRNGVDFNVIDLYGKSVLFEAISNGRSAPFLKNLIGFGADWRMKGYNQNTVLHIAAYWGKLDALKLFIQLGADVNALNSYGETPWHKAQQGQGVTRLDILSELSNHGANVNIGRSNSYMSYRRRAIKKDKLRPMCLENLIKFN